MAHIVKYATLILEQLSLFSPSKIVNIIEIFKMKKNVDVSSKINTVIDINYFFLTIGMIFGD